MKVLIVCFFFALFAGIAINAFAQTGPSAIRGKVLTQNNLPSGEATVVLLRSKDSSIVSSAVAEKNVAYHSVNIRPSSYLQLATTAGWERLYSGP